MNKQMLLLAATLLAFSTASFAADTAAAGASDKGAAAADTAKPPAEASGSKARRPTVPETAKDRENKKKCRSLDSTWQLGHCNVG